MGIEENEGILFLIPGIQKIARANPDFLKDLIFKNSGDEFEIYKKSLKELINLNENPPKCNNRSEQGDLSSKKGKLLEEVSKYLVLKNAMYKVKTNLRNNTNEIDLLLQLNDLGNISIDILPACMKDDILIECKNYNKTIGVTWIGKFATLLDTHNIKLGIIFSYKPIAGKNEWDSAKGLIKKIYLKKGIAILNFSIKDFNDIADNVCTFVELIQNKFDSLRYQTDIDEYMKKHPAMN
jgi:hypothetical protein